MANARVDELHEEILADQDPASAASEILAGLMGSAAYALNRTETHTGAANHAAWMMAQIEDIYRLRKHRLQRLRDAGKVPL